ncbi:magnesium transporter MgtC [Candidatus Wolfebacteria bacterium]|nr:MAG: magnesium transporter MgtC [Candidatus Wolfebacteria bacterium]
MEAFLDFQTFEFIFKLFVAMLFGMSIGLERLFAHKTAGMRTYALVSMGAALFVIVSQIVSAQYIDITNFDPLRIASQVIVGVGFLGAGLIFFKDEKVSGLTSASGLWVSAGIGISVGFGLYLLALIATLLTLFIFVVLWAIEHRLRKTKRFLEDNPNE